MGWREAELETNVSALPSRNGARDLTLIVPSSRNEIARAVPTRDSDFPALDSGAFQNGFYMRFGKRVLDIVVAAIALVVFMPVMVVTALVVIAGDGFPVLYRQARAGRAMKPFMIVKFRTMRRNSDQLDGSWKKSDPRRCTVAAGSRTERDPRVFRGGHTLRRLSCDELPQLWNVLRGDMSIVGPRPLMTGQVEDNIESIGDVLRARSVVRPGITGLWQVSGRSNVSFDGMMDMDLKYVRRVSFRSDLKIMLKTFYVVLVAAGAA